MRTLSQIAATDIGLEELPKGSNLGPALQKFFEADDLIVEGKTNGYPWCAAAVSFWVQTYLKECGVSGVKPPRIAAVALFPDWAELNKLSISKTPKPNDIVIFQISHIGVVESVAGDIVTCIEGNTNGDGSREGYGVFRKQRQLSFCKQFIRLPSATEDSGPFGMIQSLNQILTVAKAIQNGTMNPEIGAIEIQRIINK
jgi:hypothetical protein